MPISELEHYLKNQNQYTHEKFELRHAQDQFLEDLSKIYIQLYIAYRIRYQRRILRKREKQENS